MALVRELLAEARMHHTRADDALTSSVHSQDGREDVVTIGAYEDLLHACRAQQQCLDELLSAAQALSRGAVG